MAMARYSLFWFRDDPEPGVWVEGSSISWRRIVGPRLPQGNPPMQQNGPEYSAKGGRGGGKGENFDCKEILILGK